MRVKYVSGGSRILKRGVPVCDLECVACPSLGAWSPEKRKKKIFDLLRSFLAYSWGEIAKVGQPTAKPSSYV